MNLKNLRNAKNCEWVLDKDWGSELLEVSSSHALTQAAGYLKYTFNAECNIFFRGQAKIYKKLLPGLFRNCATIGGCKNAVEKLSLFIRDCHKAQIFLNGTPEYAYEALLQHYGIRTRWIDVVDSLAQNH